MRALTLLILLGACCSTPNLNDGFIEMIDALECKSYKCDVMRCESKLSFWNFWSNCEKEVLIKRNNNV